jgi:hypothetical protein
MMQQSPVQQVQHLSSGGVSADPAWGRLGRWDPVLNLPNVAFTPMYYPMVKFLRGTAGSTYRFAR